MTQSTCAVAHFYGNTIKIKSTRATLLFHNSEEFDKNATLKSASCFKP